MDGARIEELKKHSPPTKRECRPIFRKSATLERSSQSSLTRSGGWEGPLSGKIFPEVPARDFRGSSVDRGAGEGCRVVLAKRWDGRGQLGDRGFIYQKDDPTMSVDTIMKNFREGNFPEASTFIGVALHPGALIKTARLPAPQLVEPGCHPFARSTRKALRNCLLATLWPLAS